MFISGAYLLRATSLVRISRKNRRCISTQTYVSVDLNDTEFENSLGHYRPLSQTEKVNKHSLVHLLLMPLWYFLLRLIGSKDGVEIFCERF